MVGAGIIGLAAAREVVLRDPAAHVTVIDKEPVVGAHQTSHNSGVVHAGIYYPAGSLKATLCRRGVELLRAYCDERSLPYEECGKVIVAHDESELAGLDELEKRGHANGVECLRRLGPYELRGIEPHAVGKAALFSPRTAITDFAAVARAFAEDVRKMDGSLVLGARVTSVAETGSVVRVRTTRGDHEFDRLLVCAGLQSDYLADLCDDEPDPRIIPFRGEYWMLRPDRRDLVRGLIYPVPDPRYPFLGVHLTRRIDGEILVGPNAVLAFAREGYRFTRVHPRELAATVRWRGFQRLARQHWRTGATELYRSLRKGAFVRQAQRYVPDLRPEDVVRGPAGVRAQAVTVDGSLVDDFRISHRGRIVNVRNAPSPAATSSMAIAERLAGTVT